MLELWIAIAGLLGAYACFITIRLIDMRRERDEATDKYNSAYGLGHSAGWQAAAAEQRKRVPYADGYRDGWAARDAELARAEGRMVECTPGRQRVEGL